MLLLWQAWMACSVHRPSPEPVAPSSTPSADPLSQEALREQVAILSSDDYRGRGTGSPELARAADYLAEQLRDCGLQPLPGRDSFHENFTLYQGGFEPEGTTLRLGEQDALRLGEDWRPMPMTDEGRLESELVFAGYGITAPEHDYDDYSDLDVEGKVVLLLRHEPSGKDPDSAFDGLESTEHATFVRKAVNAFEHGAVGFVLVTDPAHHEGAEDLRVGGRFSLSAELPEAPAEEGPQFLAVQIQRSVAEELVASTGHSLETLQRLVDEGTPPSELSLGGVSVSLSVQSREQAAPVQERNVAAYLPGGSLQEEVVVVGAHYDHIGAFSGTGDTIFNGADDNASGTAGMLQLACAFAQRPEPLARSLVFLGFSAEEMGLLGSQAWVAERGVEDVVFMLNLDMIGRNPDQPVVVMGDGYGSGLGELVTEVSARTGLPVELGGSSYQGNSDHHAFFEEDVPVLFFFAGLHDDYHQLSDHIELLDFPRMQQIVLTAQGVIEAIAEGEQTPRFIHHIGWLGVRLQEGVVLDVEEDSRAGDAGLQTGDRLQGLSETALASEAAGRALSEVEPGATVTLQLQRGEEELSIEVERARTGFLGIMPGPVSEELQERLGIVDGSGVLIRQLVPEGPAQQSGLEAGDVILQLAGRPISLQTLSSRLQRIGAGEPVETLVARGEERVKVELVLGERPTR